MLTCWPILRRLSAGRSCAPTSIVGNLGTARLNNFCLFGCYSVRRWWLEME
nr:MAG TPA: hypothetical protein [Caudoviricetes sp.]